MSLGVPIKENTRGSLKEGRSGFLDLNGRESNSRKGLSYSSAHTPYETEGLEDFVFRR